MPPADINPFAGALNEMLQVVLPVDPANDEVLILHSRSFPEKVNTRMGWSEYLARCSGILSEEGREMLLGRLSGSALLAEASEVEKGFSLDISYKRGPETNWLTVTVKLKLRPGGGPYAYVFVRQSNEEHLLMSIIDLFVYSACDYFIYLNARTNSYVMFSGSPNGTPLPPAVCDDYDTALVEYARAHVVPEDQEMTIREMRIGRVLERPELDGVHAFTTGVIDPVRGHTRKRLEYRCYDRSAQMVLLSRTDVTDVYFENKERSEALREARHLAETDSLTGVLNYGGLHERVTRSLEGRRGDSALLFIDLDDFKAVNDTMGHGTGDELLRRVAETLCAQLWERDICGRVGGDEFVVFLPELRDRNQALECAARLCHSIARLWERDGYSVSCSIGVAFAPGDGSDYGSLSFHADRRACAAKARGKNQFFAG